jgi:hypothetical protein
VTTGSSLDIPRVKDSNEYVSLGVYESLAHARVVSLCSHGVGRWVRVGTGVGVTFHVPLRLALQLVIALCHVPPCSPVRFHGGSANLAMGVVREQALKPEDYSALFGASATGSYPFEKTKHHRQWPPRHKSSTPFTGTFGDPGGGAGAASVGGPPESSGHGVWQVPSGTGGPCPCGCGGQGRCIRWDVPPDLELAMESGNAARSTTHPGSREASSALSEAPVPHIRSATLPRDPGTSLGSGRSSSARERSVELRPGPLGVETPRTLSVQSLGRHHHDGTGSTGSGQPEGPSQMPRSQP